MLLDDFTLEPRVRLLVPLAVPRLLDDLLADGLLADDLLAEGDLLEDDDLLAEGDDLLDDDLPDDDELRAAMVGSPRHTARTFQQPHRAAASAAR